MRKKLVAANWKMNGSLAQNEQLLMAIREGLPAGCEVLVCPSFPYLVQVAGFLAGTGAALGAQTLSEHPSGAYTGEVSAAMLRDFGCSHVLVGHSERRNLFVETDEVVAEKFAAAQALGLIPVLCVGESQADRLAGRTEEVVLGQLAAVVGRVGVNALASAVLAYEPVWAIGTGLTATAEQAQAVHAALRAYLAAQNPMLASAIQILYGGSVKAQNAAELFGQPDIDGGLIGGASLVAEEFLAICRAAN
ncbi:MAG: triose-phosphate isomerase [Dechloromonas sp.]|nr:triose-phosphate isomerase [Dechloromonas sp.]